MSFRLLRGICIASMSAMIITFVVFFFSPLLPINVFESYLGLIFFLGVILLSFVVYIVLPPELLPTNSISQKTTMEGYENSEDIQQH